MTTITLSLPERTLAQAQQAVCTAGNHRPDTPSYPITVCGLSWSWLVVLANHSRIAGAEDCLSNTPRLPRLGMIVAQALHGQMDIVGR